MVSSDYDAFILEQDGTLTERIFDEYSELSLSAAPRVTHASSAETALEMMKNRRFDMVIAMIRLVDMDVVDFGKKVKQLRPGRPVVLMTFDNSDQDKVSQIISADSIDAAFVWSGNAKILLAAIKYVEDLQNVEHDIKVADVRVIIVVEDSIRYYSSFLAELYSELMVQSASLYSEGVNRLNKMMHMRARPKILHAVTIEQAMELFEKYQDNVLAVISDVRFYRKGKRDPRAGFKLVKTIRKKIADIPLLMISSEVEHRKEAEENNIMFVDKNSSHVLNDIRNFLVHNLGFGDFIFRMPDGSEVGRAADLRDLEEKIKVIPEQSLWFHSVANHFSIWLNARSEFHLANLLKPQKVSDFESISDLRNYLIEQLHIHRKMRRRGLIAEFRRSRFEPENRVLRFGDGSIGGKARGIAFVNTVVNPEELAEKFPGLDVRVPQTLVLSTEIFDKFMADGQLFEFAIMQCDDDVCIMQRFMEADLPPEVVDELRFVLQGIRYPLAVRSSSLLEDSYFQPFAGIYSTYMLPNNSEDDDLRLEELCKAIKLVYASTFQQNAQAYLENTARRLEEEKMAVVIQGLVGHHYGDRFYPTFSGVAQSYNYYPIGHQMPEDGITMLAMGLGRMVVDGGQALRFCPKYPQILPQFPNAEAMLKKTQTGFWALDLKRKFTDIHYQEDTTLGYYSLADAEQDETLASVGSIYNAADDMIRDGLDMDGPRVVSFNNILKHGSIPLAKVLIYLMKKFKKGMASDVEMEFAVDMGDWGKPARKGQYRHKPTLHILQLRPIVVGSPFENNFVREITIEESLCRTEKALGHGLERDIHDIVYVRRETFDPARSKDIAAEIGKINKNLSRQDRNYILIGPGRWGTADPWLGIPVQWAQISSAKVIVEASPNGYNVDPSQGTHFFQNITSLRIGYLTIPPGAADSQETEFVDWKWLDSQDAETDTEFLRHLHFEHPMLVNIDGRIGSGVISKPCDPEWKLEVCDR